MLDSSCRSTLAFFKMCPCYSFSIFIFLNLMQMALMSALRVWQGRLCQRKAKIFFLLNLQVDHFGLIEFSQSVPVTFHSVFSEFIFSWCGMKWYTLSSLMVYWKFGVFLKPENWSFWKKWKYILLLAAVWFDCKLCVPMRRNASSALQRLPNKGR